MSTTDEREHDSATHGDALHGDALRPAGLWTGADHEAYLDSRPSGGVYNPAAEYGDRDWREPESDGEAAARTAHLEAQPRDPATPDWVQRVAALQRPDLDRAHEQLADAELDLYQAGHFRDDDELDELCAARDQAQARVDVLERDLAQAHTRIDLQTQPEDSGAPSATPAPEEVAGQQIAELDQPDADTELDEDGHAEPAPAVQGVQIERDDLRTETETETDRQETDRQETDQQETGEAEADEEEL